MLISSVRLLSRVWLFATPWIAARQASLSITNSWSSLRLTSIINAHKSLQIASFPLVGFTYNRADLELKDHLYKKALLENWISGFSATKGVLYGYYIYYMYNKDTVYNIYNNTLCIRTYCLVAKSCLTLLWPPMDSSPPRPLCPWDFSSKNARMGFLLQGIFPIQESNPHLH